MANRRSLDPADLLVGPRGRRMCLELARRADDDVARAVFHVAHDLDPGAGTSRMTLGPGAGHRPTLRVADVADAVARAVIPPLDEVTLIAALDAAVAAATYWQQPDGEDVLAAAAPVRTALRRIADAVAVAPGARWWATPMDATAQVRVEWVDPGPPAGSGTSPGSTPGSPEVADTDAAVDARAALAMWRADAVAQEETAARERPTDPAAMWSALWWSTPPTTTPRTSRDLAGLGPVGLVLVEDTLGWERATVTPAAVAPGARVLEIDGPVAWAHLCRRHPLSVTASRRHDWFRATGLGDVGWVQPDWAAVARAVDAVHVTVAGYLTTAGRAVTVDRGVATVLAGWDPDATYWLTGAPRPTGPGRPWAYDRTAHRWAPVA